ncbi:MAG: 30S ribosomal protein S12 methylthiotransferase RimO [Deltaproteobacteria bacterium]|nr:30S ribosomal protein S12 methylthiotransferase RimO [Deltaproteobacteria bacterium]
MSDDTKQAYAVSLGCPRNRVDTEKMLSALDSLGFESTLVPEDADLILVNTCAFLGSAVKESIETILELAENKKHKCKALVVTGCFPARYKNELLKRELPEVDLFLDPSQEDMLAELVRLKSRELSPKRDVSRKTGRMLTTPAGSAYLRVSDGCNRQCSFCIIPKLRGMQKSRPIEEILLEAKDLVSKGVVEINLVAQDLSAYGRDLQGGRTCLADLLVELDKVKGLEWIRCMYLYPSGIDDQLIDVISKMSRIAPYLDVPIQHVSSTVLKAMKRGYGYNRVESLIKKLRHRLPRFNLRTTVMVGHPGETGKDFEELLSFIQRVRFEHLGAFRFSPEQEASAFFLEGRPTAGESYNRWRRIMAVQRKIARSKQRSYIGREVDVLITGQADESTMLNTGRHSGQAPDVDGRVYVRLWEESPNQLEVGRIYRVKIEKAMDYDLLGVALEGR